MIKGLLFDFNGVLLLDTKWHEEAWNELSVLLRNRSITKEESEEHIHGTTPNDTLEFLLGRKETNEEVKDLLDRKEKLYQEVTLSHGSEFRLNNNAIELFEFLEQNNIKKTIATSSPLVNVEFYYKYLNLERWFPFVDIVFGDGSFPGKPAPDIFLRAAKKINIHPQECLVIEDANSGVQSAKSAGVGKIYFLLNSENTNVASNIKVDRVIDSLGNINLEDFK